MPEHRLIVVASEQMWPNLYTIEWLASESEGLASLDILHTNDKKKSLSAAERLEALMQKIHPQTAVNKHLIEVDFRQIEKTIDRIIENHALDLWTININGGTKLIAVGLSEAIDKVPARFIYRDIDSQWYQIVVRDSARELAPIDVPEDRVNGLPMEEILALHFDAKEPVQWIGDPPKELPVLQLFMLASECGWDWKEAFQRSGIDIERESSGSLFEKVIGAIALEFRPASIWINAKAVTHAQKVETELDVVAHTSGVLVYIDCKLGAFNTSNESLITQVRDAATALQSLGGKNAKGILLRPNCEFDEVLRSYAESRNLVVIDQSNFRNLVTELSRVFGKPIPCGLKKLHKFLQQLNGTAAASRFTFQRATRSLRDENIRPFDLEEWFASQVNSCERTWAAAWQDANTLVIRHKDEVPHARKAEIATKIRHYWREYGTCSVQFSNSNLSFTIKLRVQTHVRRKVERILNTWGPNFRWTEQLPPPARASQKPKRIVTHAGAAHADEVVSILIALGSDPEIACIDRVNQVSERDLDAQSIYVLDIGNRHDPNYLNFDHHQFSEGDSSRCTLTLVLEHFGLLNAARRYWPWLEPFEKADVFGTQAVAEMLGVSRQTVELLRQNPLETGLLGEMSSVRRIERGHPLFETMERMGANLLKSLRDCEMQERRLGDLMRIREWASGRHVVIFPSTKRIPPDTFSVVTELLIRQKCPDAEVKVADDLRGKGLALIRLPNARDLDFNRCRGRENIAFVHHTGFLAVTDSILPDTKLCELIRIAATPH